MRFASIRSRCSAVRFDFADGDCEYWERLCEYWERLGCVEVFGGLLIIFSGSCALEFSDTETCARSPPILRPILEGYDAGAAAAAAALLPDGGAIVVVSG